MMMSRVEQIEQFASWQTGNREMMHLLFFYRGPQGLLHSTVSFLDSCSSISKFSLKISAEK